PESWRGEYPNPAFMRMTERDGAWAARIIARFTPAHIAAAVRVGDFTDPAATAFLTRVLIERQRILLRRYLSRLSPITDGELRPGAFWAVDLARTTGVFQENRFRYRALVSRAGKNVVESRLTIATEGRLCMELSTSRPHGVDSDEERYVVVRLTN